MHSSRVWQFAFALVCLGRVCQAREIHGSDDGLLVDERAQQKQPQIGFGKSNSLKELASVLAAFNPFNLAPKKPALRRSCPKGLDGHYRVIPATNMALAEDLNLHAREQLQREVLDARSRALGPEHPDTLGIKSSLAKTLRRRSDLEGAEELQRDVLEARIRILGHEHPDTLSSKSGLAEILKARGDLTGVEKLHREVFDARMRTLGPDHLDTVKSKSAWALSLQSLGNNKGAEELQREILQEMEECVPHGEPLPPAVLNFNQLTVDVIKGIIDQLYRGRDIARFYVLETVARIPYFAYLSVLHLFESFGMRDQTKRMRTHYAEADNELHHLLIMESLGGSEAFHDRFIAQHLAFGYYWYSIIIYLFNPQAAYHLSELIEAHAFNTYNTFLQDHDEELKSLPVPDIARQYYGGRDALQAYLQESEDVQSARVLNSLYDVFLNIRDDEAAHWRTLVNLVQHNELEGPDGCPIVATEVLATA